MNLPVSFNWLVVVYGGFSVLSLGWWLLSKDKRGKRARPDETTQETLERLGIARTEKKAKRTVSSKAGLSAAELLGVVEALRAANAQWPAIVAAMNPKSDATIGRILRDIRGPHQFAPQVALNAIEEGWPR